jgi:CubicO group peptidase (beta-lactamase class C family)
MTPYVRLDPRVAIDFATRPPLSHRWTSRQLVRLVARDPLMSVPGTTFAYSNTNYVVHGSEYGAAASLVSTAGDLDRFFRALFTGRVIPRSLVALMQSTQPVAPGPDYQRYGLGLEGSRYPCGSALGHGGNIWGYRAVVRASANARHLIVLLVNYDYDDLITQVDRTVSGLFCQRAIYLTQGDQDLRAIAARDDARPPG